jgi:spore maturation protein CgeB
MSAHPADPCADLPPRHLRIVVIGLSLSSSWGNGHATTYRALLKGLATRGHQVLFLEQDQPWYADNRDLPEPGFCRFALYRNVADLDAWRRDLAEADIAIVGSYVADGVAVARRVRPWARLLAFYDIDTPVTLARLHAGECSYLDAATIPLFDLYLSFTGGPTLRCIEQRYGAAAARVLHCAADPDLYRPIETGKRWDLGYLGTYSQDRQPALERLLLEPARRLPERRFVVAGPQYPADIAWPANVERIEHLAPRDHAAFYSALRWTLNVTRADMVAAGYSPSVRLFEAAACGTPILSDFWVGLNAVFRSPTEIVIAHATDDATEALALPEGEAQAIGEAARARFLADHTAAHRAAQLEGYVEELLSAASSSGAGTSKAFSVTETMQ